jgi:hypothetical protein
VPAIQGIEVRECFRMHSANSSDGCCGLWFALLCFILFCGPNERTSQKYQGEFDPRCTRSGFYVAAQLLQNIHAHFSGSKQLYELSEVSRASIFANAQRMGLFEEKAPTEPADDSLDARWEAWVQDETRRRIGLAVNVRIR